MTKSLVGTFWSGLAARRDEVDRVAGLEDVMGSCYTERRLFCSIESSGVKDNIAQCIARTREANSGLGSKIPAAHLGKLLGLRGLQRGRKQRALAQFATHAE